MAQKTEPATLQRLLERLPGEIAASFSAAQLAALETLWRNENRARQHAVDMRMRFGLGSWRYYAVILAGPESRPAHRRSNEMSQLAYLLTIIAAIGLFALQALFLRYGF